MAELQIIVSAQQKRPVFAATRLKNLQLRSHFDVCIGKSLVGTITGTPLASKK